MFLKSFFITSFILLSYTDFFGQGNFPYDQRWKQIDSLIFKNNLPKSALTEVNQVYTAAKKEKQEAQWVKAIIYRDYLQEINDQNINDQVRELESEISSSPAKVSALLKSIEAAELLQFLLEHRYQFRNRTAIITDTSSDINTWTIKRLMDKISDLYLSSLDNADLLKRTPLENFKPVLVSGNSRDLRPTLFDLLAWRALEYFTMANNMELTTKTGNQLQENPALFSEALYFMHYGFTDKDSLSNPVRALRIYQQLLRFHAKDVRLDAWIDADISRIQFVYEIAQMPEKDSLYLKALNKITGEYGSLAAASKAWFLQAQWWYQLGASYDALRDTVHRYDFIRAAVICESVLRHPDSSEGKTMCSQLLDAIHKRSLGIKIEQVNIPDLPFRVLLSYKNINCLYGRVIRIDEADKEWFDQNDGSKYWQKLNQMPVERYFQQQVPDTRDYQQHRVEMRIDALKSGQYILVAGSDASFSDSASLVMATFFCSGIAFIKNGLDYFVLDRDSGHPLKSVTVKSFLQRYDKGKIAYQPLKTFQTDQNGHFRLSSAKDFSNQIKLEFRNANDYLTNSQYVYYRSNDLDNSSDTRKYTDNIFTDRSIYRPGQIIYFKGLLIAREPKARKYRAAVQQNTTIYLLDVNRQKIDSLILKSNNYGSVHGSFKLPYNLLNGEFTILDEKSGDNKTFSVEDYKRPSFYVMYDSVKDSYKVGDSIKISGYARAYAGNSLDQARLIYRVFRQSRFPYPWMFRSYPSVSETVVAFGETITERDGKFNISFIAEPDRSVPKAARPSYSYRIESTITDLNGESISAAVTIVASYQSFEISCFLSDESTIPKDSLYNLPVTTINAAGIFIKEELSVSITNLIGPARLIRRRYWEQPDQFVMSEHEFINYFPNDEYRNESDVKSWNTGRIFYSKRDSTNMNGSFKLDKESISSLRPGWYVLEFKAKDVDGEEIIEKKFIEIRDNGERTGSLVYNLIKEENKIGEPGTRLQIQTASDANNLYVIRFKQTISDTAVRYDYYTLDHHLYTSMIEVGENDRGGFSINDIFIKNNRWYTTVHNILVPWTNKDLHISYENWRDKTTPGNEEQCKLKITGFKKDQMISEVLASMYDASLDQFVTHSWSVPDIYPVFSRSDSWDYSSNFNYVESRVRPDTEVASNTPMRNIYDELLNLNYSRRERAIRMMSGVNDMVLRSPVKQSGIQYGKDRMGASATELARLPLPKVVKDDQADLQAKPTTAGNNSANNQELVRMRKNFNETVFFQPDLKTDVQGNITITFTMPDALTKWKWMLLANRKDLSFGYSEKFVFTQKELMIQSNMPRFFRAGDTMMLPVKLANLSSSALSGTVKLEWLNAVSDLNVDSILGNNTATQPFRIDGSQSGIVFFPVIVPVHFNDPLLYRITAKTNIRDGEFSDGEENIIPVLSNRILVTESLPLNVDRQKEKHFRFEKLIEAGQSNTLQSQFLTVEFTTNPVWYVIQSLPYLIEFPDECTEQTFNRFYANALASHIVEISPAIRAVFEKWKYMDSSALLSSLQKNEELKTVLLRETPWVLQAQTETLQKKNLALLFDMIKMRGEMKSALEKLHQMQSEDGSFAWFKGGPDDRFITQYIISGIGRLRNLKAIPDDLRISLDNISKSAIAYLDKNINSDFERRDTSLINEKVSPIQIQYLYTRSFFPDINVPGNIFNALNYYRKLTARAWENETVYMQGMIALFLNRSGDSKTADAILASLKENAIHANELGMYWKTSGNGYYWQDAPVETQSLLIEAFGELHADNNLIGQMKRWLLGQKRTNHWPTTKSTADACYALLVNRSNWIRPMAVDIRLGDYKINSGEEKTEAGTCFFKRRIPGNQVSPDMGNIDVKVHDIAADSLQPTPIHTLPKNNRQQPNIKRDSLPWAPAW